MSVSSRREDYRPWYNKTPENFRNYKSFRCVCTGKFCLKDVGLHRTINRQPLAIWQRLAQVHRNAHFREGVHVHNSEAFNICRHNRYSDGVGHAGFRGHCNQQFYFDVANPSHLLFWFWFWWGLRRINEPNIFRGRWAQHQRRRLSGLDRNVVRFRTGVGGRPGSGRLGWNHYLFWRGISQQPGGRQHDHLELFQSIWRFPSGGHLRWFR